MKTKKLHINLSLGQYNYRPVGEFPAEDYGCGMCFLELKCKM